ncbi:hypothetical protein FCL40_01275 [Ferrimonas sediminicola]|uniref:DUF6701 domain-containing protein n=1 Tax=Ferrimonas sediminicola TaxID=2569538 RepID=A0A4U1BKR1_9GAMM|nr:DUF6701 domain-containing protein [Ferrimonas sediminicola]TKB51217.1 hypothetical protein FCL40_01275 [Ferrimonas sediminicola]
MARLTTVASTWGLLLALLGIALQVQAASQSYIDMDAHPTESLKVMINEINIDEGYIEVFFRETITDSSGWQIQWASNGIQGPPVVLDCRNNSCQANAFRVFHGFTLHPNHIEVMVTAPPSPEGSNNSVVHYVRSSNNVNSIKNKQIWIVDDSVATDVFKNGSLENICAKPDGSALDSDWERCEPTEGSSNDGGETPEPPYIHFGRVNLSGGTATIQFPGYTGTRVPLLFLMPPIDRENLPGQPPASVRIASINNRSATITSWGPDGGSSHGIDSVDFLVVTEGVQSFQDLNGTTRVVLEAGTIETCDYKGRNSSDTWFSPCYQDQSDWVEFRNGFGVDLAVLAELQSYRNLGFTAPFYTARSELAYTSGVHLGLEGSEVINLFEQDETLAWLAIEGSAEVLINGELLRVEAGNHLTNHIFNSVTAPIARPLSFQCGNNANYSFSATFPAPPYFFSNKRTREGADGGWARACFVSDTKFNVAVDEDWQFDADREHMGEYFSYLAIEAPTMASLPRVRLRHPDSAISCVGAEVVVDICTNSNCTAFDTDNTYVVTLTADQPVTWENLRTGESGSTLQVLHGDRVLLRQSGAQDSTGITVGVSSHDSFCLSSGGDTDCLISFNPSGLLLSTDSNFLTSCKTGDRLVVTMVDTSSNDPRQCLPVAGGDEVISFSFAYKAPEFPQVAQPLSLDGQPLAAGTTLSRQMNFEIDGTDSLPIRYDEAGKLRVRASINGGPGEGQATLFGEADIDWLPAGLHISAGDALCTAGDASCAPFMKAGSSVEVDVTAHCWVANDDGNYGNNPRTRNFRHPGIDLEPELVAPSGGHNSADLPDDVSGSAVIGSNGAGSVARVLDEVGVFRFVPKNDIDYLGHQLPRSQVSSANIGRVTPAYLSAQTSDTRLEAYCNDFSYLGQPVAYSSPPVVTVAGHAIDGRVTHNFDSEFWNLPNPMASRRYGTQSAAVSVEEPGGIAVTVADDGDLDGSRRFGVSKDWIRFSRPASAVAPLGTVIGGSQTTLILPASAFSVAADQLCLGQWGSCEQTQFGTLIGGSSLGYIQGPQLRYGRAVLASAYGSESQAVSMPLTLEYYNGRQFATNLLDTAFFGDGRVLNAGSPATSGRVTLTGSLNPLPTTSGQAYSQQGVFDRLAINGTGAVTTSPLTLEYHLEHPFNSQGSCSFPEAATAAPLWLQWYWDGDQPSVLKNPTAEVTLGRFRGHDKVIYRRELF